MRAPRASGLPVDDVECDLRVRLLVSGCRGDQAVLDRERHRNGFYSAGAAEHVSRDTLRRGDRWTRATRTPS